MVWDTVKEKKAEAKKMMSKIVEMRSSGQDADKASKGDLAGERDADLNSGMELLEIDFLLGIIENTKGDDKNDVTMRKLNFNELLRRDKQDQIDSSALKVYALNLGNLYGKDIQCAAMKELTKRTRQ
ncbi:MAG: hypothetical protein ACYS1A_05445 [Planctomycetota bacterium]